MGKGGERERERERQKEREHWLMRMRLNRAFADFVLGSLILHFFCVNFIN